MKKVVIIAYGCGNIASVKFACERLGVEVVLSDDAGVIAKADRLILPGVGAAGFAMGRLSALGLISVLQDFKRPLLGVCLGHQLLFEASDEGDVDCLGLLSSRVSAILPKEGLIVPHMGWNALVPLRPHPLSDGIVATDYAYFVHSFAAPVTDDTVLKTHYGQDFSAMVARENIMGCQFHPERSSHVGAKILDNFLRL